MKKIATITFHWGNNYGAILQSLALQRYLMKVGFNTEIINYLPFRTMLANTILAVKKRDFAFFRKTKAFKRFRKNELIISKRKYHTNKELFLCQDEYSAVITGSDQIWNMSFARKAEGKITLSYYLNFVGEDTKRISYAASFGTNKLDENISKLIKSELEKYHAISVRENSAVKMLNEIGISSECVVDPTLLLTAQDYTHLLQRESNISADDFFAYIIHSNQTMAKEISRYVGKKFSASKNISSGVVSCGIYQWLYKIKNAKFVVTNSFHGTVFALIFHTPFITVAIPNSGMNDRIITLLDSVGLSDRIFYKFDKELVDEVLNHEIEWKKIDEQIEILRTESESFIAEALR